MHLIKAPVSPGDLTVIPLMLPTLVRRRHCPPVRAFTVELLYSVTPGGVATSRVFQRSSHRCRHAHRPSSAPPHPTAVGRRTVGCGIERCRDVVRRKVLRCCDLLRCLRAHPYYPVVKPLSPSRLSLPCRHSSPSQVAVSCPGGLNNGRQ